MKTDNQRLYESMPSENREADSARPAVEPPTPDHLKMTPARKVALFAAGFRPNKRAFKIGRYTWIKAGEGWEREGKFFIGDTAVLAELHRLTEQAK